MLDSVISKKKSIIFCIKFMGEILAVLIILKGSFACFYNSHNKSNNMGKSCHYFTE